MQGCILTVGVAPAAAAIAALSVAAVAEEATAIAAVSIAAVATAIRHHLENHLSWLAVIREREGEVAGILMTGWSRYDHYATHCELLSASLPSLYSSTVLLHLLFSRQKALVDESKIRGEGKGQKEPAILALAHCISCEKNDLLRYT